MSKCPLACVVLIDMFAGTLAETASCIKNIEMKFRAALYQALFLCFFSKKNKNKTTILY